VLNGARAGGAALGLAVVLSLGAIATAAIGVSGTGPLRRSCVLTPLPGGRGLLTSAMSSVWRWGCVRSGLSFPYTGAPGSVVNWIAVGLPCSSVTPRRIGMISVSVGASTTRLTFWSRVWRSRSRRRSMIAAMSARVAGSLFAP
jgi:hypothetical protein